MVHYEEDSHFMKNCGKPLLMLGCIIGLKIIFWLLGSDNVKFYRFNA